MQGYRLIMKQFCLARTVGYKIVPNFDGDRASFLVYSPAYEEVVNVGIDTNKPFKPLQFKYIRTVEISDDGSMFCDCGWTVRNRNAFLHIVAFVLCCVKAFFCLTLTSPEVACRHLIVLAQFDLDASFCHERWTLSYQDDPDRTFQDLHSLYPLTSPCNSNPNPTSSQPGSGAGRG